MFGWLKRSATSIADAPKFSEAAPPPPIAAPAAPAGSAPQAPAATTTLPAKATAPTVAGEPPPKVGMAALEIAPKSRRKAVVTLVHADRRRLVARIEKTGVAYSYARQADGTYRLAGRARADAPRLVLGAE